MLVEPEQAAEEAAMNELTAEDADDPGDLIPDERLRLIFTCCHPALAREAQVALTLRLLCGIPTPDVARAFLVPEPTVAARITRAKKKISAARIPYRVPRPAELPERLRAVLAVIHLLYTTGHTGPLAMVCGPQAALAEVDKLERDGRLSGYHYLPAVKADLLSRLDRTGEAAESYRQAFDLAANEAERVFLAEQIADHTLLS